MQETQSQENHNPLEFKEGDYCVYTLVRSQRGIKPAPPKSAIIKRIYSRSGFCIIEFADGKRKQVRLKTLSKQTL